MKTKTMYKILISMVIIMLFLVGIYIGLEISKNEEQTNIIATNNNEVSIDKEVDNIDQNNIEIYEETYDEVIDVSIKYTDIFPDCGHNIETEEEYKSISINEIKKEIEDRDLGYRLIGQEDGILIYQKVHSGKCRNHYKIILEDGKVNVYRLSESGEFEYYQDTEITVETIREGIKEKLEEGIIVDELEELILIIEDIES